jgi:hypothetical protein
MVLFISICTALLRACAFGLFIYNGAEYSRSGNTLHAGWAAFYGAVFWYWP